MTIQIQRSATYLLCNTALSCGYCAFAAMKLFPNGGERLEDRALWSILILVYAGAQVLMRILVNVGLAVAGAMRGRAEDVDIEDEFDKAIDRRSTGIVTSAFAVGLFAALATQAFGAPLSALFGVLAADIVVSGLAGDIASLVLYKRSL